VLLSSLSLVSESNLLCKSTEGLFASPPAIN
jgi:hypothetical protein